MAQKISKRTTVLMASIVLLVMLLLIWQPQISWTVDGTGKIFAAREWVLRRDNDGQVISETIDHRRGGQRSYTVLSLQRGDVFRFNPSDMLSSGSQVNEGTEMGAVISAQDALMLEELQGALQEARALLLVDSSGAKDEVVSAARQYLSNRQKQYEAQQKIVQRQKELYESGLLAEQEYEYHQTLLQLYETEVAMARAQLAEVQSGAKPEQLSYNRQRIESLNRRLEVLNTKQENKKLIAPFSGRVAQIFAGDTLLLLRDNSSFIVNMIVPWRDATLLKRGDSLTASIPGTDISFGGEILLNGQESFVFAQKAMTVVSASVEPHGELMAGLPVKCSVYTDKLPFFSYLERVWNSLF